MVSPIPGAVAFVSALVSSGLDTSSFKFLGFLPKNLTQKRLILSQNQFTTSTLILYESPHTILSTLNAILNVLGNRNIVIAKELTKIHESFIRGSIKSIINKEETFKGEYVILIEKSTISEDNNQLLELSSGLLEDHYKYYKTKEMTKKEIIKQIAKDRGLEKNLIYQHFLNKE